MRRRETVTQARDVGAYRLLGCTDSGASPKPGQFYMLTAAERWGGGDGERPFLPRAFSYLRAQDGQLEFLWEDVGPGTRRLSELAPGDDLYVLGPLGNGFTPAPDPVLVGGGIGIVPLACWQDEVGGLALLGFRDERHAEAAELMSGEVELATDDGSAGHHGFVTELLVNELDAEAGRTVYACGPPPMLETVRAICAERDVPAQLALESGMACGFGACFGCVVPTREGYLRLCVDGPVLEAATLEGVA